MHTDKLTFNFDPDLFQVEST